ncbi:MAG: DUF5683 domain-containing protein [Alphaproteobacteria bacterium]|nr:DUF5683 domain-containing protein [Alphaproteobacteria bacterium]
MSILGSKFYIFLILYLVIINLSFAAPNNDSSKNHSKLKTHPQPLKQDTSKNYLNQFKNNFSFKQHKPKTAIILSAILPGLGQVYNKNYWKVPIVVGVVAIPVSLFFYNNNIYNQLNFAIKARQNLPSDSTAYFNISPDLNNIKNSDYLLALNRDAFRENRTLSLFWIFITWGLNVAEAAVAGHLKSFSVSKDLSLDIAPQISPTHFGAKLVLHIGK